MDNALMYLIGLTGWLVLITIVVQQFLPVKMPKGEIEPIRERGRIEDINWHFYSSDEIDDLSAALSTIRDGGTVTVGGATGDGKDLRLNLIRIDPPEPADWDWDWEAVGDGVLVLPDVTEEQRGRFLGLWGKMLEIKSSVIRILHP